MDISDMLKNLTEEEQQILIKKLTPFKWTANFVDQSLNTEECFIDIYNEIIKRRPMELLIIGGEDYESERDNPVVYCESLLFDIGKTNVIAAEGGSGKTSLALELALASKYNAQFLGSSVMTGSTLYLSYDCSLETINSMYLQYGRKYNKREKFGDVFMSTPKDKIDSDAGLSYIEKLVEAHRPKLVVVDSLFGSLGGDLDTNGSKARKPLDNLSPLATKYGFTILWLHHTNKSGKFSGSMTIRDAADCFITMSTKDDIRSLSYKPKDGGKCRRSIGEWNNKELFFKFKCEKVNNQRIHSIIEAEINKEEYNENKNIPDKELVFNYIKNNPNCFRSQILSENDGKITTSNLTKVLQKLVKENKIKIVSEKPLTYSVV